MKNENENIEIIETSDVVLEETKKENIFKKIFSFVSDFFKKHKSNKLKNDALLKRGGYSVTITAIVLAGLIVFNWLTGVLSKRFHLEFDMTSNQKNSISEENIEYIKNIDDEVTITVCGSEENYADYVAYYAQNYYNVAISSSSDYEYFDQTMTLISKYADYNKNITVKYVDPQSTEFTAITSSYPSYSLTYGDVLVTSTASGSERVKQLTFSDIYATSEDTTYASYGYTYYTLKANKLESALTSAIAYVTSAETKKVAVISGHSENSYTSAYIELLTANNYEITEIANSLITEISSDYDAVIISAPTIDFIGSELDVLSKFLDNDGKLGKGLIFFADATCPGLPNFYDFLEQWGISVGTGIVFETNTSNHIKDQPSTIGVWPNSLEDDDITENLTYAIADYNVPMNICTPAKTEISSTALMKTNGTTVVAPIGSSSDWADYTEDDMESFDSVIQSVESDYDGKGNTLTSYVMAFSSVEYIQSTWASYSDLCNQDITLAATDRAAHIDNSISFTSKVIENESFASSVTASSSKVVSIIFMFIVPIVVVAVGIVIYVRRRNAR